MKSDIQTTEQRRDQDILPPVRVCLTPTRNERWIIDRFLAAAKCWADHVVVADQGSTDGTLEEAKATAQVQAIINDSPTFDEVHRQRILLDRARTIAGRRVLLALDADEALSANSIGSNDWKKIANSAPGTKLRFRWVNILPGFERAWIPSEPTAFGLVDDGSAHGGRTIHNPRLPWRPDAPVLDLEDIVVLHFQYVVWDRMESKQRWYQALEHCKLKNAGPLDIFRQYNHMYGGWRADELHPIRDEWIKGYEERGIDFKTLECEHVTWWDRDVARMLREHGNRHFRRIAIWDKNWEAFADETELSGHLYKDPRSLFEKAAHKILKRTQKSRTAFSVRVFERFLRTCGW